MLNHALAAGGLVMNHQGVLARVTIQGQVMQPSLAVRLAQLAKRFTLSQEEMALRDHQQSFGFAQLSAALESMKGWP